MELSDTIDGEVVWTERFSSQIDDVHRIRAEIIANVMSALEIHVPINEANWARTNVPENFDAWSLYHVGLQHMYRFNKTDNAIAAEHFQKAITCEPGFARAHAGLSFTSFQNAFLKYTREPDREVEQARRFAERGFELDPFDPFANFNLGRVHWLEQDLAGSMTWLDRSIEQNPSYAQGIDAKPWAATVCDQGSEGRLHVNAAIGLSPLDPLHYAMLATKALTYVIAGDFPSAATWAERAARSPYAHYLIELIAVAAHGLNGDEPMARYLANRVPARRSDVIAGDFFRSFPFVNEATRRRLGGTLMRHGIES
ncbi:MAG: hypothetical protein GY798_33535 [Hyphomicrobiales bacterium]|nr:hypothetical protein [Hyphomicrobiales bacterium]